MMIRKVVLTGGPCAGKSTVLGQLKQHLGHRAVFVPEAATQLFASGMPTPRPDWTDQQWLQLQVAITRTQLTLEAVAAIHASLTGRDLIICDRAPQDGLAYPMGPEVVATLLDGLPDEHRNRYHLVIHLESLATARPHLFGRAGNEQRYESVEEAQASEMRTRQVWQGHPRWSFLPGSLSIPQLTTAVASLIERL